MGRCIYLRKGEAHTAPVVGIKAGDLPIGQIVKLMEGGVETEFIVVNQGIPENSSLYDVSCNGTWLLRKDIKENKNWGGNSSYATSTINTWLNGDYFNSLGSIEQEAINQIKIPYVKGGGYSGNVESGANGLSVKVFLLGGYEVGWTTNDSSAFPVDAAKLSYFIASTAGNSKRIAYLNGSASRWYLRSPSTANDDYIWLVLPEGGYNTYGLSGDNGIRPCLIIPSTSIFDPTTYLLKK